MGPVDITTIGVSCDNSVFVLVGEQGKASRGLRCGEGSIRGAHYFHISHMGAHGKTPASTLFAVSHNNRWHCGRQADSTVRLRGYCTVLYHGTNNLASGCQPNQKLERGWKG